MYEVLALGYDGGKRKWIRKDAKREGSKREEVKGREVKEMKEKGQNINLDCQEQNVNGMSPRLTDCL